MPVFSSIDGEKPAVQVPLLQIPAQLFLQGRLVEGAIAHIGGAELDTKSLARFISR